MDRLKSIPKVAMQHLENDGWTIERLATITPAQLMTYTGIGYVTAKKIIKEAIEIVNQEGVVNYPVEEENRTTSSSIPIYNPPTPPEQMSTRVRRIYEELK